MCLLRHAIEAGWPRRGTRLGAEHESAAPPQAAGAKTCRKQQVLIQSKENFGTYCSYNPFLSGRARALSLGIVGRSPMSRDADGISNSFWLLFSTLLTSVAILTGAIMASS